MTTAPVSPAPANHLIVTAEQLEKAFAEWDRRHREEPDTFMSEVQHLLKETPESYGAACALYLRLLLREQGASVDVTRVS